MTPKTKVLVGSLAVLLFLGIFIGIGIARRSAQRGALAQALAQVAAEDTYHVKTELLLHLPPFLRGRERPFQEIAARVEGDVAELEGAPQLTGTLYAEAKGQGNIFFSEGELRILSDATAFRLTTLPVLLNPSGALTERWTYVPTSLLTTHNKEQALAGFVQAFSHLSYQGRQQREGRPAHHYQGSLPAETEEALIAMWREDVSGNEGLHVLARLLQATNARSIEAWVDVATKELVQVKAEFVRPLQAGGEFSFAVIDMQFSNYGAPVAVDRPTQELTVSPAVFAKLFGRGEVAPLVSD